MPIRGARRWACAALLSSVAVTLNACDREHAVPTGWNFADLPAPAEVEYSPSGTLSFGQPRRYGTADGLGYLGRIAGVAANSRVVVVADAFSCNLVVFSRETQAPLHRFGRCGNGPGEFKDLSSLQLRGDSIVVSDLRGTRTRIVSLTGDELRRFELDTLAVPTGFGVRQTILVSDSLAVFNTVVGRRDPSLRPGDEPEGGSAHVHLVSLRSSRPTVHALYEGDEVGRLKSSLVSPALCVTPGSSIVPAHVVALNAWIPQVVTMPITEPDRPQLNLLFRGVPQRPIESPQDPTRRIKGAGHADAACGDSIALVAWRTWRDPAAAWDRRNPTAPDDSYLIAIKPGTGEYLTARLPADPTHLLGEIAAGHGNAFFFVHNFRYEFPLVVEADLQPDVDWVVLARDSGR